MTKIENSKRWPRIGANLLNRGERGERREFLDKITGLTMIYFFATDTLGTSFADYTDFILTTKTLRQEVFFASLVFLASSVFKASFVTAICIRPLWLSHYSLALS